MQLTKKQQMAIKAIFNNPQAFGNKCNHAQTVLDIIFQTQVYLLGITNEERKKTTIELRINSLVKELRHGKHDIQYGFNYRTEPVDSELTADNEENNKFWDHVKTLLIDSVNWNYQKDIIKSSLKKKVLLSFLTNPTISVSEHSIFIRENLLKYLQPDEQNLFRKEFLEIDIWAKAIEREYQTVKYPVIPTTISIIFTAICYGINQISPLTTVALLASEVGGAYLWGIYHPKPLPWNEAYRRDLHSKINKDFLNENKLNCLHIFESEKKEEKIVYTKFDERLPFDTKRLESHDEEITRPTPKKKTGKPKAQQPIERTFDINSNTKVEKNTNYQWGEIDRKTEHVVETWGKFAQPNCFTFLNKNSPTIKKFKNDRNDVYKQLKKIVRSGHVVPPDASEGIKKLSAPFKGYTHEAKLLGAGEKEYRFFAKEVKSSPNSADANNDNSTNTATLFLFDYCGPALHQK